MKTLIIYEMVPEETKLFLVDGDRSDLDGHFVNSTGPDIPEAIEAELVSADTWGKELKTPLTMDVVGLVVVRCGFFL